MCCCFLLFRQFFIFETDIQYISRTLIGIKVSKEKLLRTLISIDCCQNRQLPNNLGRLIKVEMYSITETCKHLYMIV